MNSNYSSVESKEEETDNEISVEMKTNENSLDKGIHIYGETVSQTVNGSNMLDFISDIFIQYRQGNLPRATPEETAELLRKWFDGSIKEDVEPQLHEQSTTPIETDLEQCVRNVVKRQRVDSDV